MSETPTSMVLELNIAEALHHLIQADGCIERGAVAGTIRDCQQRITELESALSAKSRELAQAERKGMLEAAKVCETVADSVGNPASEPLDAGIEQGAKECAAAIRALAGQKEQAL